MQNGRLKWMLGLAVLCLLTGGVLWAQSITVTAPAAGTTWCKGQVYVITWSKTGVMDANVKIRLFDSTGTVTVHAMTDSAPNSGSYSWTVPTTIGPGTYMVRVKTVDNAVFDNSEPFTIADCAPPPGPAPTITVTAPATGASWRQGTSQTIRWTKSGSMDANVKIRLYNSSVTEVVLPIVDSVPNSGSYTWTIPNTVPAGTYVIRVRTVDNAVFDDGTPFAVTIANVMEIVDVDLSGLRAQRDLELLDLRYVLSRGGQIVARVKNHISAIDADVVFRLVLPEMARDGLSDVTRRITLPAGGETDVYLRMLTQEEIPLRGLLTRVSVDGANRIVETNERNNTREKRLGVLDISCMTPRNDLHLSKLIMQGGKDYRVRYKIRVRHNLGRTLSNIRVEYEFMDEGGFLRGATGDFNIASLAQGEEWVREVDETFGKEGQRNADYPRLREGKTYRIVTRIVDPGDLFYDCEPRNDTAQLTFRFDE